jgi:hypothetical protein
MPAASGDSLTHVSGSKNSWQRANAANCFQGGPDRVRDDRLGGADARHTRVRETTAHRRGTAKGPTVSYRRPPYRMKIRRTEWR